MPDELDLVRARVGKLGLAPYREEEILRELAGHLEDQATALEASGMGPEEAVEEALDSVPGWPELRAEIIQAETEEETMNYRAKVLWLPAVVGGVASSSVLAIMQLSGLAPLFYGTPSAGYGYLIFYIPWLACLPVGGAAVAYWSQRAGGRVLHRLLAALAPALAVLNISLVILLVNPAVCLLVSLHHHCAVFGGLPLREFLRGFGALLGNWVLLPALALFAGAAPFLRMPHARAKEV